MKRADIAELQKMIVEKRAGNLEWDEEWKIAKKPTNNGKQMWKIQMWWMWLFADAFDLLQSKKNCIISPQGVYGKVSVNRGMHWADAT